MQLVKQLARKIILPVSINCGFDKLLLNTSKKTCCIINFHGVRKNNHEVFNNRHITDTEFEKIIIYFKNTYNIVPLSRLFEMHRNKEKPLKKTIALTFDDGYENNFTIALPILKKHHVPATFYLISKGLIDTDFFSWPDVIDVIKKNHNQDITINNLVFKYPSFYNQQVKLELLNYLKTCGDKTENLVDQLSKTLNYHRLVVKKSPELIQLIRANDFNKYKNETLIEIGSHTHTHFSLQYLEAESTENELSQSKHIIEQLTGKPITSLAFPDGSYTKQTIEIALKLGYANLVAVDYKYEEHNSNPNLLSRFTISNSTTFQSNALRLAKHFDKYGFN